MASGTTHNRYPSARDARTDALPALLARHLRYPATSTAMRCPHIA